jgi:hypothetical protein
MNGVPRPPPRALAAAAATALMGVVALVAFDARAAPAEFDPEAQPAPTEQAVDDSPTSTSTPPSSSWADDAPAPADSPQLRNLEPRTRVYVDGSLAQTTDLSSLPHIAGTGRNLRLAAGGSLKLRRFQLDIELPASQATTVNLQPNPDPGIMIAPGDLHQTALSIGDLRIGVQWTDALPVDVMRIVAGFGVRVRVPTHTTRFQFYNELDGSVNVYALPYYFHIEPAILVGGALGPLSFVMNQGGLVLMGPDASLGDLPIVVPTLYFWDAHYAVALRIIDLLTASVEINSTLQLNHIEGLDFQKLNNVFALSVVPGLQWHFGRYRVDTVARIGLTRGAELLGVVGYSGTRSFVLRLGRVFD